MLSQDKNYAKYDTLKCKSTILINRGKNNEIILKKSISKAFENTLLNLL